MKGDFITRGTMHIEFEHDHDDPPPRETYIGFYYGIFNRWAEELGRLARLFGFL